MSKPLAPATLPLLILAWALSWSAAAPAQTLSTEGSFDRYVGDVDLPSGFFEAYVNGIPVPPYVPPVLRDGYPQGELLLPPGTASVEFKDRQIGLPFEAPNLLSFTGVSNTPTPQPTDAFKLGTLTITNGIFFPQANFDITVRVSSGDPFFDGRSFSDTLHYVAVFLAGDPVVNAQANADYVELLGWPQLGRIYVYEAASGLGNTGTVDLYGRAGSLVPLYFANPTGGAFIQTTAIPEPATWIMLGGWLIALAGRRRSRKGA